MELINVRNARSIWLVDIRDLNPNGISLYPIIEAIKDRYKFQTFPSTAEELVPTRREGVVFAGGTFAVENRYHTVNKLTIYGDGLVVDTGLSTAFSDAFLEDLSGFVSTQFGLTYRPGMIHKKAYLSELIVRIEKPFGRAFEKLAALLDRLTKLKGVAFELVGLGLGADPKLGVSKPADFRLERELGKPFEQNRYYSLAPLQTHEHEELLRDFEEILTDPN